MHEHEAQVVTRAGMIGLSVQRGSQVLLGLVEPAGAPVHQTETHVPVEVRGGALHEVQPQRLGLGLAVGLRGKDCLQSQSRPAVGDQPQMGVEGLHGGVEFEAAKPRDCRL